MCACCRYKPRGWEAVKCVAIRANVAIFNPKAFYKGNRCAVWKVVLDVGMEAVHIAFWMVIASNPVTAGGAIALSTALGPGVMGKILFRSGNTLPPFDFGVQRGIIRVCAQEPRKQNAPTWGKAHVSAHVFNKKTKTKYTTHYAYVSGTSGRFPRRR